MRESKTPLTENKAFQALAACCTLVFVGLLAYYGIPAHDARVAAEQAAKSAVLELTSAPVMAEVVIPSQGPTMAVHTHYSSPSHLEGWMTWETAEMLLVSGGRAGEALCPSVIAPFLAATGRQYIDVSELDRYRASLAGTKQQVWVKPVRLPSAPDVTRCPFVTWDETTKAVSWRGLPVAILVRAQPNLTQALDALARPGAVSASVGGSTRSR